MVNKIKMVFWLGILIFGTFFIATNIHFRTGDSLFPGIIGDMILVNNETGNNYIKNMTLYDDFRGYPIQGYKSTYSGRNGTMVIYIAQMNDNITAESSLEDMAIRMGFNYSLNQSYFEYDNSGNVSKKIIRLPVNNPTVYAIEKKRNEIWHYTFTKKDKIYWIGFNNTDIEYQLGILQEAYSKIDK